MSFTQAELRYLSQRHSGLPSIENVDFGDCPQHVFDGIMERRARTLGPVFDLFRVEQRPHVGPLPAARKGPLKGIDNGPCRPLPPPAATKGVDSF